MTTKQMLGWSLVCLVATSSILPVLAYPSSALALHGDHPEGRKFAEKPNSSKKVAALENRNDLDDLSTNQIPVS
jgi:hypothetical protein